MEVKSVVLLILDGWGERKETAGNAITAAKTPCWDHLIKQYPHTLISGCGVDVGLPEGQMGNSEVGHLTIGAGRVIYQDLSRISKSIEEGSFETNPTLLKAFANAQNTHNAIHVMGLLSPGGVHSHEKHLFSCLDMASKHHLGPIYLHAFLDGRDTPPKSAMASLEKCEHFLALHPQIKLASLCGRYYAMDRDNRWERIQMAFDAIVYGRAPFYATSGLEALNQAYARQETDEFVKPTCILDSSHRPQSVHAGDSMIFMNFRSDRARELTYALTSPSFEAFDRGAFPKLGDFVTLTEYDPTLDHVNVAFKPQVHRRVLGEYLQDCQLSQLHMAETEKYAHVTFFFNGGREAPFTGEERILIPSPRVSTYDLQPQMSAIPLTEQLVKNILSQRFDFIVCNYANADMLGHTGHFEATVQAIETLDACIKQIMAAIDKVGSQLIITADHGNAECMQDLVTGSPHTAHTHSLVPFLYFGKRSLSLRPTGGTLSDIAPTLLELMGLKQPEEMTGHSLILES